MKSWQSELSNSLLVKSWQLWTFKQIIGEKLAVRDFPTVYWWKVGSQGLSNTLLVKGWQSELSNSLLVKNWQSWTLQQLLVKRVRDFPTVSWWKGGSQGLSNILLLKSVQSELSNSLLGRSCQSWTFQQFINENLAVRDFQTVYWGEVGSLWLSNNLLVKSWQLELSNRVLV